MTTTSINMVYTRQRNDCVVTALANYTGRTYDEVYDLLEKVRGVGEGNGNGYYTPTYLFALACLIGKQLEPTRDVYVLPVHGLLKLTDEYTGNGHLVAVRDGLILDGSSLRLPFQYDTYKRMFPQFTTDVAWR